MANTEIRLARAVEGLYPNFGNSQISHPFATAGREILVHLPSTVLIARLACFDIDEAAALQVVVPPGRHIEVFESSNQSQNPSLQTRSIRGVFMETTRNYPIIKQARFGPALIVSNIDVDIGSSQYGRAMGIALELTGKIINNLTALV